MTNTLTYGQLDSQALKEAGLTEESIGPAVRQKIIENNVHALFEKVQEKEFYRETLPVDTSVIGAAFGVSLDLKRYTVNLSAIPVRTVVSVYGADPNTLTTARTVFDAIDDDRVFDRYETNPFRASRFGWRQNGDYIEVVKGVNAGARPPFFYVEYFRRTGSYAFASAIDLPVELNAELVASVAKEYSVFKTVKSA